MVSMVVAIFFILLAVRQSRLPKVLPSVYGICSRNGEGFGVRAAEGDVQCAVVVRRNVVEVRFKWGDKDTLGPSISSPRVVRKSGLKIFFLPAGSTVAANDFDKHAEALGWRRGVKTSPRATIVTSSAAQNATAAVKDVEKGAVPRIKKWVFKVASLTSRSQPADPRRPSITTQYAVKALAILTGLFTILAVRLFQLLRAPATGKKRRASEKCSLGVFLGSGGHTSEMIALLSTLDLERYTPRIYVYCTGDSMSITNIVAFESTSTPPVTSQKPPYTLLALPRARRVAQPLISSAISTLRTLLAAIREFLFEQVRRNGRKPWVDLLIINGPGTAVVLVAVCWLAKILGLPSPTIIYVESFARVKTLSMSGKLLRPFVDQFVVQWPDARKDKGKNVVHQGWLV